MISCLFFFVLMDVHSLGQELPHVLAVGQQLAHDGGADAGELGFGEEQDGLYARQLAVDVGDGLLVLEVLDGADASYDEIGADLPREVDGQAVIRPDADARLVAVVLAYHLLASGDGEMGVLVLVDAYADDNLVDEGQGAPHHRGVSGGEGVECAGKYGSCHFFYLFCFFVL